MREKIAKHSHKIGKHAMVLVASGMICKALGALFRIPLTSLIGIEKIGIFQLIMSLYAFALVLTSGGTTTALSKLISSSRAKGDKNAINIYLRRALLTSLLLSVVVGLLFLMFSNVISNIQKIPPNPSYCLFIVLLPLGAVSAVLRGYFQGHENMYPTSISQVLEQTIKFALGLLFAYLFGKNAVFGAFLGITLSEVLCALYLFVIYSKNKEESKLQCSFLERYKEYDKTNLLLLGSVVVLPLTNALDSIFIIPRLVQAGISSTTATKLFGLQSGIVGTLLNLPLVLSISIATALLPNLSYLVAKGTKTKFVVEKGLKILTLAILPSVFGLVAVSSPLFSLLYKNVPSEFYNLGQNLMLYSAFSTIFMATTQYLLMVLQAFGKFKFCLIITLFGGMAKVVITFVFSAFPNINIFAVVLGNIIMSSTICIMCLTKLKRMLDFSFSFAEVFTLAFSTTAMYFLVKTFVDSDYFSPLPTLLCAMLLGLISYSVFSIPFFLKIFQKKNFQEKKI